MSTADDNVSCCCCRCRTMDPSSRLNISLLLKMKGFWPFLAINLRRTWFLILFNCHYYWIVVILNWREWAFLLIKHPGFLKQSVTIKPYVPHTFNSLECATFHSINNFVLVFQRPMHFPAWLGTYIMTLCNQFFFIRAIQLVNLDLLHNVLTSPKLKNLGLGISICKRPI